MAASFSKHAQLLVLHASGLALQQAFCAASVPAKLMVSESAAACCVMCCRHMGLGCLLLNGVIAAPFSIVQHC
jgi:hypothetical protein